jgi:hypothetical protein
VQIDVCGEIKLVFVKLELELSVLQLKPQASGDGAGAGAQTPAREFFFVFFETPLQPETKDPFSLGSFTQD